MADLAAALSTCETAVGRETLDNKAQAWRQYNKWCKQSDLGQNLFLNRLPNNTKLKSWALLPGLSIKGDF
jgi:hypothetical protein